MGRFWILVVMYMIAFGSSFSYGEGVFGLSDLAITAESWLMPVGAGEADLTGDGMVNLADIAILVRNWGACKDVSEHIYFVSVEYGINHNLPVYNGQVAYYFEFEVETDSTVERLEFSTPSGNQYEITGESYIDLGDRIIETSCYESDDVSGEYEWNYEVVSTDSTLFNSYGDGEYVITIYYHDGSSYHTALWYGVPNSTEKLVMPSQVPVLTSIANGYIVNSPVNIAWEQCLDTNVNWIGLDIEDYDEVSNIELSLPLDSTSLNDPIELYQGQWQVQLEFLNYYSCENSDGIELSLTKHRQNEYHIESNGRLRDHVSMIAIDYGYDYNSPELEMDDEYDFEIWIQTDASIERIAIETATGNNIEIVEDKHVVTPNGSIETSIEYGANGSYGWRYEDESMALTDFDRYGDGEYTISFYYRNGSIMQTKAIFGGPFGDSVLAQPTQMGVLTGIEDGGNVSSPLNISWEPCVDANAKLIWFEIISADDSEEYEYDLPKTSTCISEPFSLTSGEWEIRLCFAALYTYCNEEDIEVYSSRYSESNYIFYCIE